MLITDSGGTDFFMVAFFHRTDDNILTLAKFGDQAGVLPYLYRG